MQHRESFSYWVAWTGGQLPPADGTTDDQRVAKLLDVSPRTVRHWRATQAPAWALRTLVLLGTGISPHAAETWPGWRFIDQGGRSFLCGPEGSQWLPDDLYRFRTTHDHLSALQERVAPGAQLRWEAPGSGRRNAWPGGTAPTWAQLEDALRGVIEDALRRRAA